MFLRWFSGHFRGFFELLVVFRKHFCNMPQKLKQNEAHDTGCRQRADNTCELCHTDGAWEVELDHNVCKPEERDGIEATKHGTDGGQHNDNQCEHDLVIEKLLDENCETLKRELADALILPRQLPPVEWLETHVAEIPYSPIAGKFTCANSPMLRELIEAICSPRVRSVSIIASVQSGKTPVPSAQARIARSTSAKASSPVFAALRNSASLILSSFASGS